MRILSELKKYDNNLTVAELIQKIELDRLEQEKIEEFELTEIKKEFENTYLKEIDEDGLFGRTVNIYHLKNFVRKERAEDWTFSYYFEGKRMQFEEQGVFSKDFETNRVGDGFPLCDLKNMVKLTEEEYLKYIDTYNRITNELINVVKYS